MATQVMEDSYEHMRVDRGDRVVLVSGDRDYVPTIKSLDRRGFKTTVVFWEHATARDLRAAADEYVSLDPIFPHLSRTKS